MNGVDIGTIAQNFITYFGGAAGGYISAAAILVVGLLCAIHVMHPKAGWITTFLVILAWTASFTVRTLVGWGA